MTDERYIAQILARLSQVPLLQQRHNVLREDPPVGSIAEQEERSKLFGAHPAVSEHPGNVLPDATQPEHVEGFEEGLQ